MMARRHVRELLPTALSELLVLWLIVGLPGLGYSHVRPALANHIALAMALGVLVLIASVLPAASVTCGLLGAWLAASPWVIGYASTTTTGALNDLLGGLTLICLSVIQHRRASQAPFADGQPAEPGAVS